jgi:hypothetical protein
MSVFDGLWDNAKDSLQHGLSHASELSHEGGSDHHNKWIYLSAHHAAQCYCNWLLVNLEPTHPLFQPQDGKLFFPALRKTVKELSDARFSTRLTPGELRLTKVLERLSVHRDQIEHRVAPTALDISEAAMAMLGVLKSARKRIGTTTQEILNQDPPVERAVVEFVRGAVHGEYLKMAEAFAEEDAAGRWIDECPCCGARSVLEGECHGCYEELEGRRCGKCDYEFYIPAYERWTGATTVECPSCEQREPM